MKDRNVRKREFFQKRLYGEWFPETRPQKLTRTNKKKERRRKGVRRNKGGIQFELISCFQNKKKGSQLNR